MNFKEIQLVGFKSFADKTTISFQDGVSCIVGPNGCGKSNVADAVRWVLGEQSAKTLRGSNMQDVIFSGTESRRALSYCEVTLVFDNSEKLFDIEYDEVAMTRRLYRSGESEYLLNKQTCRLKDIVALLHGVGIGKEGYSIIGQGKVEQIMNAKPEDRRAIFEEATGVMVFKQRKGEIERKLENAKDNLTVFVQRMDEAEKQLKPLEKQAETAKKYREYSDDLKYNEVNTYLFRCENASVETEKYRKRMESAEARIQAIGEEIERIETDENKVRERVISADEELSGLNGELLTYEVGLERKSGKAKLLDEQISSYRRQLHAATEEVDYSMRRIAEIDRQAVASAKKDEQAQKRLAQIDGDALRLRQKISVANEKISAFEREFDKTRKDQLSSVENLSELRAATGSLSAQAGAVGERIEEVRTAIQKAKARKKDYSDQYAECVQERERTQSYLDGSQSEAEELATTARELTLSSQKLSQDFVDCNTSIANLQNNLEMYVNLKNRFDGYRESVRRLQITAKNNAEIGNKIKGAIADIVRTEQKYEVAIETAFGGAMQNLVTATADDARFLIEFLKKSGGGIVTFLPVSSMRPHYDSRDVQKALSERGALGLADELVKYDEYYDNIIKNLLGNTLVCDSIANATQIAKKYAHAFKIVTLDGDTIATSGAMTGGSHSRNSGNLLAGERHIKECEEGIARKKATAEKLRVAIEQCEKEREETERSQEELRKKVQEETANFAALSQRELVLSDLVKDAEKDVSDYEEVLRTLTLRAENLQSEVLSSSQNEDVLNKIRQEVSAELSAREAECNQIREENAVNNQALQELLMEETSIKSTRQAEQDALKRNQIEKQSLTEKIENTRKKMAQTETIIQDLKAEEERVALTEEEQARVAVLRARIDEIALEKKSLNAQQLDLGESKRAVLAEHGNMSELAHKCELEISKIESGLENWKQRIDEAYDLTYETALPLRDENYDIAQSYSTINSLKHKIAALGPVNHNAEADYDNLFARYGEMLTQKEDLDKGIDDLTVVLTDLKGEMQRKFDEGFATINENFTHIFRELFGGGRAEMQLDYTDCDDPLNAGVEIIACPPGKKLTKISLLSGGERAFTAIAILFAILKARPMPFCILDEIEAALDEANVDRFAKYLKRFSKETQFVVITHRKPTMNQADTLFGVTMEEKGVSKIVSVKLSEVEARLGGDTVIA